MLNRKFLIASIITGMVAISGCSQETEQAADEGAVEVTAENAGQDTVENTETVGESITEGANTVVDETSTAVSDGVDAVSEGTQDLTNEAEDAMNPDANATATEAEVVDENQDY